MRIRLASSLPVLCLLLLTGYSGESRAYSIAPAADVHAFEMQKKKRQGYKKPKKKKFLGIFKRKSACDCPRH